MKTAASGNSPRDSELRWAWFSVARGLSKSRSISDLMQDAIWHAHGVGAFPQRRFEGSESEGHLSDLPTSRPKRPQTSEEKPQFAGIVSESATIQELRAYGLPYDVFRDLSGITNAHLIAERPCP